MPKKVMNKMLINSSVEDCVTLGAFDFLGFVEALVLAKGLESLALVEVVSRLLGA